MLVLTGTFQQIVTYTGFSILLFSGAAVTAVIILRRRHGAPRGFAVPGYPLVPLAFVASVAMIAVSSFRYAPGPSMLGVILQRQADVVRGRLLLGDGNDIFARLARERRVLFKLIR